jgi:hypothetical protein
MPEQPSRPEPRGAFDGFAEAVDNQISRAWWFAFCLGLVLAWLVQGAVLGLWVNDTWHLELNSPTTALTFLMVAVEANAARRDRSALHTKLNHMAQADAATMRFLAELAATVAPDVDCSALMADADRLEGKVGLEERVGTKRR